MGALILVGLGLVVAGALLGSPGLLLVGGLTLLTRWLTTLWSRYGLDSIAFDRRLESDRAVWGDQVPFEIEVWNQKPLPVPLLVVDDHVSDTLRVVDHPLGPSDRPGMGALTNAWSLLWYERVVRHLVIDARRRGVLEFGPVRLTVSDLFERGTNSEERAAPGRLVVRPRTVPVLAPRTARAPLGAHRTRSSLFVDPSRFAGVRAYQPGDPRRQIHWRATARLGQPVSRRHEPVNDRVVLIAMDLQTIPGPHWRMVFADEEVEGLCVAAASISRRLLRDGAACGMLVGTQLAGGGRWAYLPPSTSAGQLGRIEDLLARIEPIVALPFERLLEVVPRRLPPGGTLLVLSSRDPAPFLDMLRRLSRSGYAVRHLAMGPAREEHRAAAIASGVAADTAALDPGWMKADALTLAG